MLIAGSYSCLPQVAIMNLILKVSFHCSEAPYQPVHLARH